MKNLFKKAICLVLLCVTLTGCLGGSFMTAEYSKISSTQVQYTYTLTKDKEIESWAVTIAGTNVKFYINNILHAEKSPVSGGTTTTLTMLNFDLEKGDICRLVITGTSVLSPATYGTTINGEKVDFYFG